MMILVHGEQMIISIFKGKEVSLITTKTIVDNFYRIRYPVEAVEYSEKYTAMQGD